MAKFVLTQYFSDPAYSLDFPFYYSASSLDLDVGSSATQATFVDDGGFGMVLTGMGFTYDEDGLSGGTVTKLVFFSSDGDLLTVTGTGYSGATLPTDDMYDLFNLLQKGNDTIQGSEGDDKIFTGLNAGNDKVFANGGADEVLASAGKNTFDGGDGIDTLTYTSSELDKKNAKLGVVIDVAQGTATNPWGAKDTFSHFEIYIGTHKNDTFKGSNAAEQFEGYRGNDTFAGGKGGDTFVFYGGADKDTITDFGKGSDVMSLHDLYRASDSEPIDTYAEIQSLMSATKAGVTIDFGSGDSLFFKGLKIADLTVDSFAFGSS